tara:strand:- start:1703 stop:1852 length:150 start_codon:yes stop_codon:yes gene_type:complete
MGKSTTFLESGKNRNVSLKARFNTQLFGGIDDFEEEKKKDQQIFEFDIT